MEYNAVKCSSVVKSELTSCKRNHILSGMASKSSNDEDDKDFLICGICMNYYDDGVHTPKILECFHSCCITCLKVTTSYKPEI